jgi:hypothetical protein
VQLDPARVGETERWFDRELAGTVSLPGSTDEASLGTPNPSRPTLDGLFRLYPYEGPAWFQYDLMIPGSWKGKRVSLVFERVHWETKVWIDGHEVQGAQDSLIAPHVHQLGALGAPGTRRLTVRVDNTKKFDLGGFVSINYEGTQTNWNGLVGGLELRAVDPVAIDDIQVYPDVTRKVAKVRVRLSNTIGRPIAASLRLSVKERTGTIAAVSDESQVSLGAASEVVRELSLGSDAKLWDEFSPSLYLFSAAVSAADGGMISRDERAVSFGMRSFAPQGTRFALNGRPIFLRGTLECAIFPRTGYPPASTGPWRKIFRTIKDYGLNFMRFHSWCPPEAAFAAADQEGVILQVEGPQANVDAGIDPARDAFMEAEVLRIVRTYGNHPSFCLMTLGNEFGGKDQVLSRWIDLLRSEDPRHLYASPSAGQTTANRQYTEGGPRGVQGPGTDRDFRTDVAHQDRPLTGHEIGQWTFFPNFDEIGKYTGVLAARNFELVRADLRAKHMLDLAPRFVQATGRHAALLYKEEIEILRRTPKYAGFSLLDLHDYPGQGTALIGILDPFWDSKGFVSPQAHRRYCGPTVPLVRLPKRTFLTSEVLDASAELAHYGPSDLVDVHPRWSLRDEAGREIESGSLESRSIPTGELTTLGHLRARLDKAPAPCKLTLSLALDGTDVLNEWEIWVYPRVSAVTPPPGLLVTRFWDLDTQAALEAGKSVVLFPKILSAKRSLPGRFLPVFWSPIWFPTQRPNTMGILCDPRHPALSLFPTDEFSNWQWFELLDHSRTLILDETPAALRPIVQVIDNFARNHRLGNLLEARVSSGRLLVCTIDLPGLAESHPAARQLLRSLYTYAASDLFRPTVELDRSRLDSLFRRPASAMIEKLGAYVVSTDSQQPGYEASAILDGDPDTIWHTTFGKRGAPFPHQVVIGFGHTAILSSVLLDPRQDQSNGWIKDYRIDFSSDGKSWTTAAQGSFDRSSQPKTVRFEKPVPARFLKLVAESSFDHQPFASLAELSVVEERGAFCGGTR